MGRESSQLKAWGVIALGAAAVAAGARVTVDHEPISMTLQTLAVLCVGGLSGGRAGSLAAALYMGLVLMGAPVLADGHAAPGAQFLDLKSAGYVVGFIPAAWMAGLAGRGVFASLAVMLGAHAVILAIGAAWLARHIGFDAAVEHGLRPFLWGALVKSVVAAAVVEHFAARRRHGTA